MCGKFQAPCNSCLFGQLFWPNNGVCQLAQNGPIAKFKKGQFQEKNCQLLYLGLHTAGHFVLNGGSANRLQSAPIGPILNFFEQFSTQNPNWKGSFYEKYIWGPTMRPISNKWECLPISPKWTNFEFFEQLLAQNQNSKRVDLVEKIDIFCI